MSREDIEKNIAVIDKNFDLLRRGV